MALFESLNLLKAKLLKSDDVVTDNLIFQLNRRATVIILVSFSFLLSLSQYVGDPIDCIHDASSIPDDTFDTYCWVTGTWTQKIAPTKGKTFEHLGCKKIGFENCWHHKYYQWVALVVLLQAGCFYFPRFLWQTWEDGKIKSLITGLDRWTLIRGIHSREMLEKGEKSEKIKELVYTWKEIRGTNNAWAWKYYFCEALNVLNVFGQFKLTDFFLGGQFAEIGTKGLDIDVHNSILPVTSECFFNTTGTGGGMSEHAGLCVLPLNMVNQKFFTIFFFWLSVLIALNAFMILVRLLMMSLGEMREFYLSYYYQTKGVKRTIIQRSSHGDWLLLTFLLDNMNVIVRSQFLHELGELKHYEDDEDRHYLHADK